MFFRKNWIREYSKVYSYHDTFEFSKAYLSVFTSLEVVLNSAAFTLNGKVATFLQSNGCRYWMMSLERAWHDVIQENAAPCPFLSSGTPANIKLEGCSNNTFKEYTKILCIFKSGMTKARMTQRPNIPTNIWKSRWLKGILLRRCVIYLR